MTNFFKQVKALWSDKPKRALILLIFWLLFMMVIVLYIRFNSQATTTKVTGYEFNGTYNQQAITGERANNKELFNIGETKYYIEDDIIYQVDGQKLTKVTTNFIKYRLESLETLIVIGSLADTINYNDGSVKKTYTISKDNYNHWLGDQLATEDVTMTIVNQKQVVKSITLKMNQQSLTINYTNINQVTDIETTYELIE